MLRTELPLVDQVNAGESNKLHVLPKMPDVRKNKTMRKVSNTDRLAICKTCRKLASWKQTIKGGKQILWTFVLLSYCLDFSYKKLS